MSMSEQNRDGNLARLRFMEIGPATRALLGDFWKVAVPEMPDILSGFYRHLAAVPHLAAMIGHETDRLKQAQTSHWERLFSGRFDDAYFAGVKTIGLVHNKIGLEPRWYIGGYNYVLSRLTDLASQAYRWSPKKARAVIRAVNCAVMLDMEIAISVYQEAMMAEREGAQRGQKLDAVVKGFETRSAELVEGLTASAGQLQKPRKRWRS